MDVAPTVDPGGPTHDLLCALCLADDGDFRVLNSPKARILLIWGSVKHELLVVHSDGLPFEAIGLWPARPSGQLSDQSSR